MSGSTAVVSGLVSGKPTELIRGWLWKKHRKRQFWTGWHRRFFTLTVWPGERNRARLESNHRIGRIYATWDKMGEAKQREYLETAEKFLDSLTPARKGWARNAKAN